MAKKNSYEGVDRTMQNAAQTLLANIRFASVDDPVRSIVVTSSIPNEGKTTISIELAKAMAKGGRTVLLVECDMRRRSLAAELNVHPQNGLYAVLSGTVDLAGCATPIEKNLWFLDVEPHIPNPPDIIASKRFRRFVEDAKARFNFVVFDTPGSNTNSNVDHVRVLREAMRGMSDGLPIYVTAYDALDSNDNAELYEQISQMPALDERFAMIVVNKADDADIPEGGFTKRDEEWVMDTVVARNLYAQGIYFVSSIAGLGAKTGGSFADRHYDRVFRRLRDGYEDPDDKYYTRLYDYDLLPEQLRAKAVREAESCDNRLLANSGLFSVEQGIDEFATKYSAYNKCYQSETLLHELIEQTDARLEESGVALESSRALLSADLDESKNDLLDSLIQLSISTCEDAVEGYLPSMNEWAKQSVAATGLTSERLRDWERDITATKRRELGAEEKRRDAEGKKAAITANLMARVQNAWDTKDVLGIAGIAKSFASDWSAAREAEAESEEIFRGADREASDDLLARVRDQFDSDIARLMQEAEGHSKAYWEERAEASRKALLDLVADGTAIDDNRREALRAIIVDFRSLSLDDELPEISEIRYPFDPNKLWKAPLRVQYNMELSQRVSKWRSVVEPAHEASFREWLHELTDALSLGAVDLNPELRRKFDSVVNTEREIEAQRSKRIRLHSGEKRVSGFMTWQEG